MKRELDHVGVAVGDLGRGHDAFSRLGFRLTPRSLHSGSRAAGLPVEPWGSGNHCAMFHEGYLEIIGLTDASLFSSVKDLVARYEGLHIVAVGCEDAEVAHRELAAAGLPVEAVRKLERDAAFGPRDESVRRAAFRNLYVDRKQFPEARFLFIEHKTRDVLWQPHLLDHPNGVQGIDAVFFVVDDPRATAERFAQLFSGQVDGHPEEIRLRLDRGAFWLLTPECWRDRAPAGFVPPTPSPVGFGLRVASLEATRAFFTTQGVCVHEVAAPAGPAGFWIAPEDACGAAILFRQVGESSHQHSEPLQ